MRKLFVIAATATIFMVGAASATTVSGEIRSIDPKGRTITLSDGKVYQLAPTIKVEMLKTGERISASYDKAGLKSVITKVEPAK